MHSPELQRITVYRHTTSTIQSQQQYKYLYSCNKQNTGSCTTEKKILSIAKILYKFMQKHESENDSDSDEEARPRKKMILDKTNDQGRTLVITPVMKKYFTRIIDPVELPEKVNPDLDNTYPGLILDGASGVGKTQQVFALLKEEKTAVVYRLLVPGKDEQQPIYRDMRRIVDPKRMFLTLVDAAIKEVNAKSVMHIGQDVFSVEFLSDEVIGNSNTRLEELLQHFYQSALKYDKVSSKLTCHSLNSREELNDVILFLDEVLPKRADNDALTRLRFLRNLGRALGMRVVMAGTAATAANMIKLPNLNVDDKTAASRDGSGRPGWMEIQFIYNHIRLALPESLDPPPLYKERPLIASILEELCAENQQFNKGNMDGKETMELIARTIALQKKFSDESILIWLCGSWLESDEDIPTSPFLLKPADLVQGHFFEPGFATWRKGDDGRDVPYFGRGICETKIAMGNHRIALRSFKKLEDNKSVWWSCVVDKGYAEGQSKGFSGVHYSMSQCVQICLAKEPIMAICLSGARPNDFQEAFARLWQETLRPPSIDGALNEFAMFAALQLASHSEKFLETKTVKDTVVHLRKLLHASPVDDTKQTTLTVKYGKKVLKQSLTDNECNHLKKIFIEEKIPWLIPACSKVELEFAFKKCGGMFTGKSWNIAGLVPGERRSRVDARAFLWDEEMTLAWVFEFKARSKTYSLSDGETDLEVKCKNAPEKDSHAMLIAVSGHKDSMVRVWLTDKDKLRVVVVVGCGYKQK